MGQFKKHYIILFCCLIFLPIIISCEKVVFPGDDGPAPINNRLYVESNPSGASIYFDDRNSGFLTPDTIKWLPDGEHKITLKHPFYIDTTVVVTLAGGSKSLLRIDHFLNPGHLGKLSCLSNPEKVDIYIDDKLTEKKTPFTFTGMMPGKHKIKYTYPMYRADSIYLAVIGGDLKTAYMFLDDTTKGLYYTTTNSQIPTDYTYTIAIDSSNIKWIGTLGLGIIRFNGKKWSVLDKDNSPLSSNVVKSLFVDKANRLWIGLDNGLFVYDGSTFTDYSSHLNDKFVTQIVADHNGVIWIATFGGLVKFDGTTWTTYTKSNSFLPINHLWSLAVDKQNRIWVGVDDGYGIAVFDGSTWFVWNMSNMGVDTKIGGTVISLLCDQDGIIWAAHMQDIAGSRIFQGGLTSYNGTKWSLISVPQINTQMIQSLNVDRFNNKWVATKFGMGRFDKTNAASVYTKVNAKLQTSYTISAALDRIGDLYITTLGGGLSKLRKGNF